MASGDTQVLQTLKTIQVEAQAALYGKSTFVHHVAWPMSLIDDSLNTIPSLEFDLDKVVNVHIRIDTRNSLNSTDFAEIEPIPPIPQKSHVAWLLKLASSGSRKGRCTVVLYNVRATSMPISTQAAPSAFAKSFSQLINFEDLEILLSSDQPDQYAKREGYKVKQSFKRQVINACETQLTVLREPYARSWPASNPCSPTR